MNPLKSHNPLTVAEIDEAIQDYFGRTPGRWLKEAFILFSEDYQQKITVLEARVAALERGQK